MNKKAQLNMEMVKAVMVAFLVLAVVAIAIFVSVNSLKKPLDVTSNPDNPEIILADNGSVQTLNNTPTEGTFSKIR